MNKKLLSLAVSGMIAGGLVACEDDANTTSPTASDSNTDQNTEQNVDETSAIAQKVLNFVDECEGDGGTIVEHDDCAGKNDCAGIDPATGETWICGGKATCKGSLICEEG